MFYFTKLSQNAGEKVCDNYIAGIDGTGKPYETEFRIADSYATITDTGQQKKCVVADNIIKDVSITDGKVQLELVPTASFNNSLKFMYYVEV